MAALLAVIAYTLMTHPLVTHISLPSFYLHPEVVQLLLLHPHAWVRHSSCRLFGLLFASYKPEEVASPSTSSDIAGKTKKKKRKSKKGQCQIMEYMLQDSVVKVREVAMVTNALLSNLTCDTSYPRCRISAGLSVHS